MLFFLFITLIALNKSINIKLLENINYNEVPYISTYYIKPVVTTNEDVIINFYVSDYYQQEYMSENFSSTFTITIKINNKREIIKKNIKAGNNSMNIGCFKNLGEQKFSIIATDEYGRNSHELFNYFLVKNDTIDKKYIVTQEDLIKYNIKSNDAYEKKYIISLNIDNPTSETIKKSLEKESLKYTPSSNSYLCLIADIKGLDFNNWWGENIIKYSNDYDKNRVLLESISTREGLQKLLDDKKAEGYNRVVLLQGTYRIDHQQPILIPTEFTLDLNGATLKQNQFTGDKSLMIELNNTFDSHIINGTLEGDYFSHDYANSPNSSEWVTGISIGGESKYSSYENLIIKDITGYGATNGISKSSFDTVDYTYYPPIAIGDTFNLGDIDRTTGIPIKSTNRTTSDFIDIGKHSKIGYLSISRYLGYQGRAFDSWNLICHFYDKNKTFIKSTDGYQYRRIEAPENAKYIKITTLTTDKPNDLYIHYFKVPTNCYIKNITFENCRSVGLAPGAMNNMLFENCTFINCGQSLTNCAFDAEDGWDMMQDCTFRNFNFMNNPKNDFLTAGGHNFIIEDMINGKVYLYPRTNSYVLRNCSSVILSRLGRNGMKETGYTRVYNNTINFSGNLEANDKNWPSIIKDCTINGTTESFGVHPEACIWFHCDIGASLNKSNNYTTGMNYGTFINCFIHDKTGYNLGGNYSNCKIKNINGGFSGELYITNSEIFNFNCNLMRSSKNTISLDNCDIINFYFDGTADYLKNLGLNFTVKNSTINNEFPILRLQYYLTNNPIIFENSTYTSTCKDGAIVLTGYDNNEFTKNDSSENRNIVIYNCSFNLINSKYIITGTNLNTSTVNNYLSIKASNNIINPKTIKLYDSNISNSLNIK